MLRVSTRLRFPSSIFARRPFSLPSRFVSSDLGKKLMNGERFALSKAITLIESTALVHKDPRNDLLLYCLETVRERQQTDPNACRALRLGISGPPGVGKSTFIEAFGTFLTRQKHKVAVLSIDPSSQRSGGSILGDKVRMPTLGMDPNAYIRPSPSGCTLGGIAQNTADTVVLCEAAGYDVVIVETVGVGQSEVAVADTVDMVMLLVPPAGGDELQGMKKGIMELCDMVVVTKADGDLLNTAKLTRSDYTHGLRLFRPKHDNWDPPVRLCSSVSQDTKSLDRIWGDITEFQELLTKTGKLEAQRAQQRRCWMWKNLQDELMTRLQSVTGLEVRIRELERKLSDNTITPRIAAENLLDAYLSSRALASLSDSTGTDPKDRAPEVVPKAC
eukprot:TRINITY_DN1026_c0_g1_i1.p1 TRINITY_DN1026_c0_g1~~TRINITY_DN1026_c0_g1_i1.p1  ORF type:complete len:388 (-),score=75.38 TRINITY_DN1026_c0_g1_i1:65-1228(-)